MLLFKKLSLVAVAAVVAMPMFAVPTLRITDCGTDGCGNEGVADIYTTSSASGFIQTSLALGGWSIIASTGYTYPSIGSLSESAFLLQGSAVRSAETQGTLVFEFFEDVFTGSPFQAVMSGSTSAVPGASKASGAVTFASEFEGNPYVSSGPLNFNGSSDATANQTGVSLTPSSIPYLVGLKTTLVFDPAVTATSRAVGFTTTLAAVPEPGFYGALALGLSGLFAIVARRRKANAE